MSVGKMVDTKIDGIPARTVEVDGKLATFALGQHKLNYLRQFNAVFLGDDFEDSHQVVVSIEGRSQTLYGYTQDAELVSLFRDFLARNS